MKSTATFRSPRGLAGTPEERLRREQRLLRSIVEAIHGELELRSLLERILGSACKLLDADHGTIGLVDEIKGVVRTEAAYRMPPNEIGAEMAPGVGVAGEVLRTGKPVMVRRYGDLPRPTQQKMLAHAVLGMPIVWRNRLIGFFGIGRAPRPASPTNGHRSASRRRLVPPSPFTRADRESLTEFARHAAIAIHNANLYRHERQRAERLKLLHRVGQIITSDLRLEELLQTAADSVHQILGYPNVAIALVERGEPDVLVISILGGTYKSLIQEEFRQPVTKGIMGAAVRTQRTVLVNDVEKDPRHIPAPGAKGIYAECAVPIMLGDECLGILNVESGSALSHEDAENLQIVADQLAVAIENARLHAATRELAAVDERHRLARELHDAVTQLIFSITLVAQSLAPAWRRDPAEGERRTQRLLDLSQQALGEMRALLAELRSAADVTTRVRKGDTERGIEVVRRLGLAEAIVRHATRVAQDGLAVCADTAEYRPARSDVEDALYRIAQEAVFNVAKHARARELKVTLASTDREVSLRISDDGRGFPKASARRRKGAASASRPDGSGLGLTFMRERAQALGGSLTVSSGVGVGTTIDVSVPRIAPPQR
jgi:signal transduction histidine kinase